MAVYKKTISQKCSSFFSRACSVQKYDSLIADVYLCPMFMKIRLFSQKYTMVMLVQLSSVLICNELYGQHMKNTVLRQSIPDEAVLDQKPYFADHQVKTTDSLFLKDINILKSSGSFEGVDAELLKAPLLKEILAGEIERNRPATYRTVIDFMKDFKRTSAYTDFISGVVLFRELENRKINLKNWENDQALFVKLGFTASDLEDFRHFIGKRKHRKLSYKQAYLQYMKEINDLGTVNK